MENKLQELTQKIYSEGIEKAKLDATVIVQEARMSADEIIKKARIEAAEILKKANENSAEVRRNAESEIKMASKQAVSKLKQQIIDLISARAVETPIKDVMKDKAFVGSLIEKVASCFNNNVELVLPQADKDLISSYFNDRVKNELFKSVDVRFDNEIKSGFKISPKNDNYIISFTDEDFAAYFKGFMRPKTIQLLFGEE
ncbi:MAG: V-type ATP synthase subunit E [Chloroflexota bacterium]|nr:hypothetical protein [Lentimicrobium sp.]